MQFVSHTPTRAGLSRHHLNLLVVQRLILVHLRGLTDVRAMVPEMGYQQGRETYKQQQSCIDSSNDTVHSTTTRKELE